MNNKYLFRFLFDINLHKANILILMEVFTPASGKTTKKMGKEFINMQMEILIKESSKMEKKMVMENIGKHSFCNH